MDSNIVAGGGAPTAPRQLDVVSGSAMNKEKRKELFGAVSGGAGSREPEKYQKMKIVEGTGVECESTHTRINLRTYVLRDIAQPNREIDGFDYSEDFDAKQVVGKNTVYINLKNIVGKGGAQTRSLREVYWFIEGQLNVLKKSENVYFANVLDGDESHAVMPKYQYQSSLPEFKDVRGRVYVGDLSGYIKWFAETL